jgi:hypothetical protein
MEIKVVLNEEQIMELFENCEVKFSKKKLKALKEEFEFAELDILESLEETFSEHLEEIIQDRFGE